MFQLASNSDNLSLEKTNSPTVRSVTGTKQIQAKMVLELMSIDRECGEVVMDAWKTMVATTTKRDKNVQFDNLEEYVDYRIIDTGAP
jgi:hypothetical protein